MICQLLSKVTKCANFDYNNCRKMNNLKGKWTFGEIMFSKVNIMSNVGKACRWYSKSPLNVKVTDLNRRNYLKNANIFTAYNVKNRNVVCHRSLSESSHDRKTGNVKRGNYSILNEDDLCYFKNLLGDANRVITEPSELESHNTDWMGSYRGQSRLLLKPRTTDEVSKILSYCNKKRIAVCPQGGNTGLVGGSVPVFDEVILSTALMKRIDSIDPYSGVVVCQAGCVLETLDNELAKKGLTVPLDLGARGTCQIGGNVATNAGGLRLLRYGSLHGNILGLEVVLADGTVLDSLSVLRKDNTGYDIKQLFIGSEGTLGIITKVAMLGISKSTSVALAFMGTSSFENVLKLKIKAGEMLGEILSAFEFMDQESLMCTQHHFKLRTPLDPVSNHNYFVLIETSGSNQKHDEEKLQKFVEHNLDCHLIDDAGIFSQPSQMKDIWTVREHITSASLKDGCAFKYDVSLPHHCLYELVPHLRKRLGNRVVRCLGFGHIGDGNIHVNVTARQYSEDIHDLLEPYIFEWISKHRGSISAEHGLGLQKRDYIYFSKQKPVVEFMKSIKRQFDPNLILNPYKVLPMQEI